MHKTGTADCVVDWAGDELLFIRFSSWLRRQAGIGNLLHSVHAQSALQPAAEAGSPRRMHIRMRDPNARSECASEKRPLFFIADRVSRGADRRDERRRVNHRVYGRARNSFDLGSSAQSYSCVQHNRRVRASTAHD